MPDNDELMPTLSMEDYKPEGLEEYQESVRNKLAESGTVPQMQQEDNDA